MSESISTLPETFKAFFATPTDETKEFKRPGGFSGKSISPFYLVKRLTERFGLCGKGWKVQHYETRTVTAPSGVTAVYILLSLLYKEKGDTEWNEVGPHYGGDVALDCKKAERQQKNADGTFNILEVDDEAFKKAYTDAFSKCCSWLGLGGDIHDGMTDGNKYVASKPWDVSIQESITTLRQERQAKPAAAPVPPAPTAAPVQPATAVPVAAVPPPPPPAPVQQAPMVQEEPTTHTPVPPPPPTPPTPQATVINPPKAPGAVQGRNPEAETERLALEAAYVRERGAAYARLCQTNGPEEAKRIVFETQTAFAGSPKAMLEAMQALAPQAR